MVLNTQNYVVTSRQDSQVDCQQYKHNDHANFQRGQCRDSQIFLTFRRHDLPVRTSNQKLQKTMSLSIVISRHRLHFSTEQSSWPWDGQEIPRLLWNHKVHDHINNRPPPAPILSHSNPAHFPTPPLEDPYYYYPPTYAQVSSPQVYPPKPCMQLFSPPYVPHSSPISFFFISSPEYL